MRGAGRSPSEDAARPFTRGIVLMRHRPFTLLAILALASACKMSHEDARADSVRTAEQLQLDSLAGANAKLGTELALLQTTHNKVFYIIGREDDLLKKGVVVREGGANLLVAHPGRTLQPARSLDVGMFTAIDQRSVKEISVPDSTRQYAVVSRQSLDNVDVSERDRSLFRGNLKIKDTDRFWSPSRYLIIVER